MLEPIDLLPSRLELFLHVVQLVSIFRFGLLDPLVKVKLDLTESLETSDEIVMEHAKVGERFGFRLAILLLFRKKA